MAFVKYWTPVIGERVITTKKFSSCGGYFEKGSIVTIIGIGERGYDIQDDEGNKIIECGWTGFARIAEYF